MSMTAPVRPAPAGPGLAPGTIVGGRFAVERAVGDDALGTIVAARDQKTQKAIALRVLGPGLIATPEAVEILRAEIKTAASITHRSLVATYGMGNEKGARFVACEWLEGQPLAVVVARRKQEDQPLSLRGAYNVIAHVGNALAAAHQKGLCHGAIRPNVVWVLRSGRVKVAELGIARAILRTAGAASLGASEQPFLAPEVRGGAVPDVRSDVFGIGGLLYTMLTGRSAGDEFLAPSRAHAEGTPELDAVLLRCLATDPSARYATPEEVRAALSPLCGGEPEDGATGLGVDVDVDLASLAPGPLAGAGGATDAAAVSGSIARPAVLPAAPAPARQPVAPAAGAGPSTGTVARPPAAATPARGPGLPKLVVGGGGAPEIGARISLHEDFRMSMPGAAPAPAAALPPRASEVDLNQLLGKITENDAARWMVQKDKLDHGPFSGRELVGLIAKGDVLGDHGLLNMDTGERRKIREHPEFVEFVEQYRIKQAALAEKSAIATAAKVETRSNAAKFMIAGGVLVLVAAGLGIFFLTRQAEQNRQIADAQLADLYERGDVQIEGTAGILPDPPRGSHRGGGGGHRRSGSGAGTSYEDAMNQVVDMGDATGSGGEGRLSTGTVAGVMNGRIDSFFSCVSAELRAGRSLGRVRIDMAIAGSGQVLGSSVRAGSNEFQRCIMGRVAAVRFPSFGAPRMGASYSFDASQ
jgi:hypothetical protein